MYTPKGELDDMILEILCGKQMAEAIKSCKTGVELLEILKRHMVNPKKEEILDSLVIILSYMEEQDIELLSEEEAAGAMRRIRVNKNGIEGLRDKTPVIIVGLRKMIAVLNDSWGTDEC